jgi:hypothetical protein
MTKDDEGWFSRERALTLVLVAITCLGIYLLSVSRAFRAGIGLGIGLGDRSPPAVLLAGT